MTAYNQYRKRCFEHHIPECAICKENRVLDIHHIDSDHSNNGQTNFIPLCPTCHRLYHSKKYRHLVETKILEYKELFEDYYFSQDDY